MGRGRDHEDWEPSGLFDSLHHLITQPVGDDLAVVSVPSNGCLVLRVALKPESGTSLDFGFNNQKLQSLSKGFSNLKGNSVADKAVPSALTKVDDKLIIDAHGSGNFGGRQSTSPALSLRSNHLKSSGVASGCG